MSAHRSRISRKAARILRTGHPWLLGESVQAPVGALVELVCDGEPVSGLVVDLHPTCTCETMTRRLRTDSNGRTPFVHLLDGAYRVVVQDEGLASPRDFLVRPTEDLVEVRVVRTDR